MINLLRTGIGPKQAGKKLHLFLSNRQPSQILGIGYCGGLDPTLKTGDLVAPEQAHLWGEPTSAHNANSSRIRRRAASSPSRTLAEIELSASWRLSCSPSLFDQATRAGIALRRGDCLTSHHLMGDPKEKVLLHQKFSAAIIDMETASLARAAAEAAVPLACVRAVSDEARDEFLAPISYDPSVSSVSRAVRVLRAGSWLRRYSEWQERAAVARRSLRQFLVWYLDIYL